MPEDIERTLERIHDRIDSLARDVHTLQLTTVKRDGPLVDKIWQTARTVDRLKDSLLTKDEFRQEMEEDKYRTFNHRDKIIGASIAVVAVITQVISTIVLLAHLGN